MQEKLFLDLRKHLAQRNLEEVNRIFTNLSSEVHRNDIEGLFWNLRIEAEILHFRRDFSQACILLERAVDITQGISLTDKQLGSLNGRFASCLYNVKSYEQALDHYLKANNFSNQDIPRSYYYKLKILECFRKLDSKSEFFAFYWEILNNLFADPLTKVWNHHLDYAWNLVSILQQSAWFYEIENLMHDYSLNETKNYTKSYLFFLLAHFSRSGNKYEEMIGHVKESLKFFLDKWNPVDHRILLLNFATLVRLPFSDFQMAKIFLEKALALSPDPDGWRIHVLNSLASVLRFTGEYSRAIQVLKESIRISTKLSNLWQLGFAHNTLGMIYTLLGKNVEAKASFKLSLECNVKENNFIGIGYTYGSMGWRESVLGNFKLADKFYSKSISSFETHGSTPPIILLAKAEVLSNIHKEMNLEIRQLLNKTHEKIWKRNLRLDKGRYSIALGNIHFNFKDYSQAEANFSEALKFTNIYEVYSQGLLGTIKVKTSLYIQTEDSSFLAEVKTKLSDLKQVTQKNSLLWAEMNLISAIIEMSEGNLEHASDSLYSLRVYSESHELPGLHSRIAKQEDTLGIYLRYNKIQDQIQNISERQNLKSQSLMDVVDYLKTISHLLSAYSSDSKPNGP